jgi:hypothetical protein
MSSVLLDRSAPTSFGTTVKCDTIEVTGGVLSSGTLTGGALSVSGNATVAGTATLGSLTVTGAATVGELTSDGDVAAVGQVSGTSMVIGAQPDGTDRALTFPGVSPNFSAIDYDGFNLSLSTNGVTGLRVDRGGGAVAPMQMASPKYFNTSPTQSIRVNQSIASVNWNAAGNGASYVLAVADVSSLSNFKFLQLGFNVPVSTVAPTTGNFFFYAGTPGAPLNSEYFDLTIFQGPCNVPGSPANQFGGITAAPIHIPTIVNTGSAFTVTLFGGYNPAWAGKYLIPYPPAGVISIVMSSGVADATPAVPLLGNVDFTVTGVL